jgi:Zn finger protein HypA/HybF involved in hydrogenase expression
MARCERCNACESQWDFRDCPRCNYPREDIRTGAQIKQDDKDYKLWLKDQGIEDEDSD